MIIKKEKVTIVSAGSLPCGLIAYHAKNCSDITKDRQVFLCFFQAEDYLNVSLSGDYIRSLSYEMFANGKVIDHKCRTFAVVNILNSCMFFNKIVRCSVLHESLAALMER